MSKHRLKTILRFIIVAATWGFVSLKPDSSLGFFQGLLIASMTSVYEYGIIILEVDTWFHQAVGWARFVLSAIYLACDILAFSHLINLNLMTMQFSFGDQMPFTDPEKIKWSFFTTVHIMWIFPFFVFAELFPRRRDKNVISKPQPQAKKVANG